MIRKLDKSEKIPYSILLLADETEQAIDRYIHQSDIYIYVSDGLLIGVYVLWQLSEDTVEIKNIAVIEEFQNQGIGTKLISDAIRRSRIVNYKSIYIGTANGAISQLYMYQKSGFEICDIRWNFFVENYPDPIYENGILCKHMIMLKQDL